MSNGIILPPRRPTSAGTWGDSGDAYNEGVNDTLDQVVALNPARVVDGAQQVINSVWLAQFRAEYLQFAEECKKLKARNNTLENQLSSREFNSAQLLARLASLTDLKDGWEKNWLAVVDSITANPAHRPHVLGVV